MPVADRAVADLVVVLQVARRTRCAGIASRSTGRPCVRPRNDDQRAVVEERAGQRLGQRAERAEVGVVALPLAGQQRVQRVVEVVVPLRVQPVARRPRAA